jgi:hypothetical protein
MEHLATPVMIFIIIFKKIIQYALACDCAVLG